MIGALLTLTVTVAALGTTLIVTMIQNSRLRVDAKELELALDSERSARSRAIGETTETRKRLEAIIARRDLELNSIYAELENAENYDACGRIAVRSIARMLQPVSETDGDSNG